MIRAQILTAWRESIVPFPQRFPAVREDHPPQSYVDVTGTPAANIPPAPNAVVIEGVWTDEAFAALEADDNYSGAVLWSEEQA